MPRQDWFDDDTLSRDRRDERNYFGDYRSGDFGGRERGHGGGAFFESGRDERGSNRGRGDFGGRDRPIGGWGGLMGDENRSRSRGRLRDRDFAERSRSERDYGSDDYNDNAIPLDETERLIASNKVEGTPVYGRRRERLGSIYNFMVDKYDGEVVYAVLRHGGFFGLGERYYPLQWSDLTYDTRLGGYRVGFEEEDLERFDSFDSEGRMYSRQRGDREGHREFHRERSSRGRERERGNRYSPW
jgi:hypothetical protein